MHDEVHGVGDHQVRDLDVEAFRGHRHVHLQAGEHAVAGVGVDGAHRPVVALRHGEHHRQRLGAADLADDDPVGLHPQPRPHQAVHRELADAFEVGVAGFEVDVVGVQLGEVVEADLEGVLDGDDPLGRGDLVDQATQQRGLAGAGAAGDDHVEPGLAPSPAAGATATPRSCRARSSCLERGRCRSCGGGSTPTAAPTPTQWHAAGPLTGGACRAPVRPGPSVARTGRVGPGSG